MKTKFGKLNSCFGGIVAALALMCSAAQAQHYYIYNGAQVPLTAVSGKVAVRAAVVTDVAQAQRSLAAAAAVSTTDTQSLGIPGWSVVNVAASQSSVLRAAAASVQSTATSAVQSLAASPSVAFAAPVFTASGTEVVPNGEILVRIVSGTTIQAVIAASGNTNITGHIQLGGDQFKLATNLKDGLAVLNLANSLNGKPGVLSAEPNFIQTINPQLVPTDPGFSQSWGLRNSGQSGGLAGFDMAAASAWDITTGSSSVLVVVLDEGIQQNHPDLNQVPGRDFTGANIAGGGPASALDTHGTMVAGCIAGKWGNGLGSVGVAPNVRVASAKIAYSYYYGSEIRWATQTDWFVAAIYWARTIGARVTNHSYGGGAVSSQMDAAFNTTRAAGIVHIAATGNDYYGAISYPASSAYVMGIGAANRSGSKSDFSNYGSGIDFLAPGESIYTTTVNSSYGTVNGTSFASPYAAGVAALVISRNPSWTAAQVEQQLKNSCTDMGAAGYDTTNGYGLINAFRALGGSNTPVDDVGNTLATARAVNVPSTTSAVLGHVGDIDMFRLTLASRMELTATTTGSTDTYGTLYNSSGAVLASNDDYNGSHNFRLVNTLVAGTYYIGVRHYSSTGTGSYALALSTRAPQEPEMRIRGNGYEIVKGDTTPSTTDHTSFGSAYTGAYIDRVFTIDNLGVADLRLSGSPVAAISGSGASQFSVVANPAATVSATRSTTFTVRFRPTGAGAFTATISLANNDYDENPYTFAITGTGAGTRDTIGNTFATAATVSTSVTVSTALDFGGDVDMFKFTLTSTATMTLKTTGGTDTFGYLYNSAGSLLTSNDDGNGNYGFKIVRSLSAGTYYLKVAGYSSSTTGAYILTLSR